jgi:hypothetical protein
LPELQVHEDKAVLRHAERLRGVQALAYFSAPRANAPCEVSVVALLVRAITAEQSGALIALGRQVPPP